MINIQKGLKMSSVSTVRVPVGTKRNKTKGVMLVERSDSDTLSLFVENRPGNIAQALLRNNINHFEDLLKKSTFDEVNKEYAELDGYKCLEFACKKGLETAVELLLNNRANQTKGRHGMTPLHIAAGKGHGVIVRILLKSDAYVNPRNLRNRTPLHQVASGPPHTVGDCPSGYLDAMQALLEVPWALVNGTSPTPIQLAIQRQWKAGAELLIKEFANPFNQNDEVVEANLQNFFSLAVDVRKGLHIPHNKKSLQLALFKALYRNRPDIFMNIFHAAVNHNVDLNDSLGRFTLLQAACDNGYHDCVEVLLHNDADPNKVCEGCRTPPILLAAKSGFYKVLPCLWRRSSTNMTVLGKEEKTVLHILAQAGGVMERMKEMSSNYQMDSQKCDFTKSLTDLLEGVELLSYRLDIDAQDFRGNTALHCAALSGCPEMVRSLLRSGACTSIKNSDNKLAVNLVSPRILEDCLDECVRLEKHSFGTDLHLNFRLLAPPSQDSGSSKPVTFSCLSIDYKVMDNYLPEIEVLRHISLSPKHKHLLKHPVIRSFLHLKWQCIRHFVYANLIFYAMYVLLVTVFIVTNVTHKVNNETNNYIFNKDGDGNVVLYEAWYIIISFLVACLFIREVFQMFVSFRRYFIDLENWFELTMLILTLLILSPGLENKTKRHISVFVVLLSWSELVFYIGKHPQLITYVTMFTTVTLSYLRFLIAFSLFVVGFGLSFLIIFYNPHAQNVNDFNSKSFNSSTISILKTMAMLTGEIEFDNLNMDILPVTSHIVLLLFLFLMAIVLLNLLNGMAVNDTQHIKSQAQLVSLSSQVQLIFYVESMLLGNPFRFFTKLNCLKRRKQTQSTFTTGCLHISQILLLIRGPFLRKALIFPSLPNKEITVRISERITVNPEGFKFRSKLLEEALTCVDNQRAKKEINEEKLRLKMMESRLERIEDSLDKLLKLFSVQKEITERKDNGEFNAEEIQTLL